MERTVKDKDQMKEVAEEILSHISSNENEATVLGLSGQLGAGKTTFVQALAAVLGVKEVVTSPTYVLLKSYKLEAKSYKLLVHIDAYRLESGEELEQLDWRDYLEDSATLICIEWPEHVSEVLPDDMVSIEFEVIDEDTRKVIIEAQ